MKLRLWERPRTAPPPSLTGVSDESAGDIPAADPPLAGSGANHADPEPATAAAKDDECCALLRGDAPLADSSPRRQRRGA
jgi:hypothetical protein